MFTIILILLLQLYSGIGMFSYMRYYTQSFSWKQKIVFLILCGPLVWCMLIMENIMELLMDYVYPVLEKWWKALE